MADHVEGSLPNAGGLRLQGKLRLCAALIRVLKRYSVGARSGGGLIEKLLVGERERYLQHYWCTSFASNPAVVP